MSPPLPLRAGDSSTSTVRALAFSVHVFTALGAALGLLALIRGGRATTGR